ncbi:hypothetical protein ACFL6O_04690 [candidate division KSB1 bacterium]
MSEYREHNHGKRLEALKADSPVSIESSKPVYEKDKSDDGSIDIDSGSLKNIDPFENLGMTIYFY